MADAHDLMFLDHIPGGYDPRRDAGTKYVFNPELASKAINFYPKYLRHVKGTLGGQPLELLPWQKAWAANLYGWVDAETGYRRYRTSMLLVPRKNGKQVALNTVIPTISGTKKLREIQVGDIVFAQDGSPTLVTALSDIDMNPVSYLVTFSNGQQVKACADHQWSVRQLDYGDVVRTTQYMVDMGLTRSKDRRFSVRMPDPVQYPERRLPVDPYYLGYWLGNGEKGGTQVHCGHLDADFLESQLLRLYDHNDISRGITPPSEPHHYPKYKFNLLMDSGALDRLKACGVYRNKHIPQDYLLGSVKQRVALLQGLMDSDGYINHNGTVCEFSSVSDAIADGMKRLLASLGVKFSCNLKEKTCVNNGAKGMYWIIQFCVGRDQFEVFRNPRKLERMRPSCTRARTCQIVSIEPIDPVPMRCIMVDHPSHTYLFGETFLPTHNSTIVGGTALKALAADGEFGPECFSAAADRNQAAIAFNIAKGMVGSSPKLAARLKVYRFSISNPTNNGFYQPICSEAHRQHGGNTHLGIFDELHALPDRELVDVIETSTGARSQPLIIFITTTDYTRESICNTKLGVFRNVRDGTLPLPDHLPFIYETLPTEDWEDPAVWRKANPSIDAAFPTSFLEDQYRKAKADPGFENEFKRLHLNLQTEQDKRWLPMDKWHACKLDDPPTEEELRSHPCFVGVDIGETDDMSAVTAYWPALRFARMWCWTPEEGRHLKHYRPWIPKYVTVTPGPIVTTDYIRGVARELSKKYHVMSFCIDPWHARQLAKQMDEEDGLPVTIIAQGYGHIGEATRILGEMIKSTEFRHEGNPVMNWMAGNAAIRPNIDGVPKLVKATGAGKVDGLAALINAIAVSLDGKGPSVYESRGVLTL